MVFQWKARHFGLDELEFDEDAVRWGIANRIPLEQLPRWHKICTDYWDVVRDANAPCVAFDVTSAYRCRAVNDLIGGSGNSQHRGVWNNKKTGDANAPCVAFDIENHRYGNLTLFVVLAKIMRGMCPFTDYDTAQAASLLQLPIPDQLIWEYDHPTRTVATEAGQLRVEPAWIHVGFVFDGQEPRRQILRSKLGPTGKAVYSTFTATALDEWNAPLRSGGTPNG